MWVCANMCTHQCLFHVLELIISRMHLYSFVCVGFFGGWGCGGPIPWHIFSWGWGWQIFTVFSMPFFQFPFSCVLCLDGWSNLFSKHRDRRRKYVNLYKFKLDLLRKEQVRAINIFHFGVICCAPAILHWRILRFRQDVQHTEGFLQSTFVIGC